MKCPACDTHLARIVVGTLEVDACRGGCGGIWFDGYEIKVVDDAETPADDALLQIPRRMDAQLSVAHRRECPCCQQVQLKRNVFSPTVQVEVDECPSCNGFWVEAAELERLRLEQGRLTKAAQPTPGMSPAAIRMLYRLRTESCDNV